jgi:hypothetical protein
MSTNVFKLNSNNEYVISRIIPSDEEVKKQVPKKILEYFNGDTEAETKVHRMGIINPNDSNFVAYNTAVERFRTEANAEIAANSAYLNGCRQIVTGEGMMQQSIFVTD